MRTSAVKQKVRAGRDWNRQVNLRLEPTLYQALQTVVRQGRRSIPQGARRLIGEGLRIRVGGPAAPDEMGAQDIADVAVARAFGCS